MIVFADRVEAGRQLAERLESLRGQDAVVLGLPRGGVPVAFEVATALDLPLDVIVVRKLGVPFQPELAMGAIGEGGVRFLNHDLIRRARVTADEVARVEERERAVLDDRVSRFRRGRERVDLHGRVAVIVDDGMATGATARVACEVARHLGAARVVLAVPVAAPETVREITEADEVVALSTPLGFYAVGAHYRDFSPTTDDEVADLLHRRPRPGGEEATAQVGGRAADEEVAIPVGQVMIEGHLNLPEGAPGIVIFAHGSGSSRHSPRNRFVAEVLQQAGLGTLLIDLLTADEERDRANVFDIELLAARLRAATQWLGQRPDARGCRVGYFGASTGAGAALWAAAEPDAAIDAVVSRGGRPDLAAPRLAAVHAPTLLIVGSRDDVVLELNRRAQALLEKCESELSVVAGATHLFEEPGTLAEAATLARDWFVRYLAPRERRMLGGG
jgi:putative phosphoribosyl transferase